MLGPYTALHRAFLRDHRRGDRRSDRLDEHLPTGERRRELAELERQGVQRRSQGAGRWLTKHRQIPAAGIAAGRVVFAALPLLVFLALAGVFLKQLLWAATRRTFLPR